MERQRYHEQPQPFTTKQCLEQAREEYIQVQRYLQDHERQASKQLQTTLFDRVPAQIHRPQE